MSSFRVEDPALLVLPLLEQLTCENNVAQGLKPQVPVLLPAYHQSIREEYGRDDFVAVTNLSVSVTLSNTWFCGKFSNMIWPITQYANKYCLNTSFLVFSRHLPIVS